MLGMAAQSMKSITDERRDGDKEASPLPLFLFFFCFKRMCGEECSSDDHRILTTSHLLSYILSALVMNNLI